MVNPNSRIYNSVPQIAATDGSNSVAHYGLSRIHNSEPRLGNETINTSRMAPSNAIPRVGRCKFDDQQHNSVRRSIVPVENEVGSAVS